MPRRTQVPHHRVRSISRTRISRSLSDFPKPFRYKAVFSIQLCGSSPCGPTTPLTRFRLFRFRSPLLPESLLISFPMLLRWFTSHSLALPTYFIQSRSVCIAAYGLPHSAIRVSLDMCSSARLFAAYHGLLRLLSPQASATDLYSLDHIIFSVCLYLYIDFLPFPLYFNELLEIRGLEPLTLGLQSRCSSQLS